MGALSATLAKLGSLFSIDGSNQILLPATPPQFDNSLLAASTAFVKRVGLQASGVTVVTASGAIAAAQAGGLVICNSASAITLTLNAASGFPDGSRIEFLNVANGAVTIAKQAGDILAPSGSNPSTFTLNNGDTLVLESRGSANIWYAVGGSTRLAYAGNFGASLAATGYQKLPSGLIVQWGFFAGSNAGDTAITFPIAFPTNFLCATVSGLCSGTGAWGGYNSATKTGMNGNWWAAASTRQSGTATYIAFGY